MDQDVLLQYLSQLTPQDFASLLGMAEQGGTAGNTGRLAAAGLSPNAYAAANVLYSLVDQGMSPDEAVSNFVQSETNTSGVISPEEREKVINLFVEDVKESNKRVGENANLDFLKSMGMEEAALLIPALQRDIASTPQQYSRSEQYLPDLQNAMLKLQESSASRREGVASRKKAEESASKWYNKIARPIIGTMPFVSGIVQAKALDNASDINWGGEEGEKIVEQNRRNVQLLKELAKQRQTQDAKMQGFIDAAVASSLKDAGISQPAPSYFDMQKLLLMRGLNG
jgi:hypothetical protein